MGKRLKCWRKTKDVNFPENTLFIKEKYPEDTTLEIQPVFEPPFKKKRPNFWMFSIWKGKKIIRRHNKDFKIKSKAIKHAQSYMKKYDKC